MAKSPLHRLCPFEKIRFNDKPARSHPAIDAVQISAECFLGVQDEFQVEYVQSERLTTG